MIAQLRKVVSTILAGTLIFTGIITGTERTSAATSPDVKTFKAQLKGPNPNVNGSIALPADFGHLVSITADYGGKIQSYDINKAAKSINVAVDNGYYYDVDYTYGGVSSTYSNYSVCDYSYCQGVFAINVPSDTASTFKYEEARTKVVWSGQQQEDVPWGNWFPVSRDPNGGTYSSYIVGGVPGTYGAVYGQLRGYTIKNEHRTYIYNVTLNYTANQSPNIKITNSEDKEINFKTGSTVFRLYGKASDLDNDQVTIYATIGGVTKQTVISNTSTTDKDWELSWNVSELPEGEYSGITVTASDGYAGPVVQSFGGKLKVNKIPLFYWDKYSVKEQAVEYKVNEKYEGVLRVDNVTGYRAYSFNQQKGTFTPVGSLETNPTYGTWVGTTTYWFPSVAVGVPVKSINKYIVRNEGGVDSYRLDTIFNKTTKVKDLLLQSNIQDFDGTYPDNGLAPDGYWYIKKSTTNRPPFIVVNNSDINIGKLDSQITLQGTVLDLDNDSVTVTAIINGVEKKIGVTDTSSSKNWKLTWSKDELQSGVFTGIKVAATDGKDGVNSVDYLGILTIDNSSPTVVISPNKTNWTSDSFDVQVQLSDDLSGIDPNERKYKVTNSKTAPSDWNLAEDNNFSLVFDKEGSWYIHTMLKDNVGNVSENVTGPYQLQNQPETPKNPKGEVGQDWVEFAWDLPSSSFTDGYTYTIQDVTTGKQWSVDYPENKVKEEGLQPGTEYKYRVKAMNHVGESAYTKDFTVLTLPEQPKGVIVSPVDHESQKGMITFDTVPSAISYYIAAEDVKSNSIVFERKVDQAGEYFINNLQPGTQYIVSVTAENRSGKGSPRMIAYLSLPAAPGEFKAAQIGENEVTLSWLPSDTASKYELQRDDKSIYSGSNTTFTDKGLESSTEYNYQVYAQNDSGFGDIGYLDHVLTLPGQAAPTISHIRANEIDVSWTAVKGAEQYVVKVNGEEKDALDREVRQYTFKGLKPGEIYEIEVIAKNMSGPGAAGKISVRTLPDVPQNLKIEKITENEATITWDPVNGADKYRLKIEGKVYEISDTKIQVQYLEGGRTYKYSIEAGNDSGYGDAAFDNLLTVPSAPDNIQIEKIDSESFKITWKNGGSNQTYKIYDNEGVLIGSTKNTQFLVGNLKPGEIKTVFITAINASGESEKSAFTQRTLPAGINSNDIQVQDPSNNSIEFKWPEVIGADKYKIVDGEGNVWAVVAAPQTTTQINGLESAKIHPDWTIIPVNDTGEGKGGKVPSFETKPSDDYEVIAEAKSPGELFFTFKDQLKNEIYVITLNGKEVYRGTDKSHNVGALTPGTSYTFEVWTENSRGDRSKTKTVSCQTMPSLDSMGTNLSPNNETKNQSTKPLNPSQNETINNSDKVQVVFPDIVNLYNKEMVTALYNKGIIKGTEKGNFEPNRSITRAEFAVLIVRALALHSDISSSAKMTFEDINKNAWYSNELQTAYDNHVIDGFNSKTFGPDLTITREQASKMLANVLQTQTQTEAEGREFKDQRQISNWASEAVKLLSTKNIVEGYPDGTFRPQNNIVRSESASMIYKMLTESE